MMLILPVMKFGTNISHFIFINFKIGMTIICSYDYIEIPYCSVVIFNSYKNNSGGFKDRASRTGPTLAKHKKQKNVINIKNIFYLSYSYLNNNSYNPIILFDLSMQIRYLICFLKYIILQFVF